MEDLIRQGLYITASVFRLEQLAQNHLPEKYEEHNSDSSVQNEAACVLELAKENLKIIESLLCNFDGIIDSAERRFISHTNYLGLAF